MPKPATQKIGLAVQGSFGHIDYATGILDAFRAHNHEARAGGKKTLNIATGSGCVEMMTPLWIYLAGQNSETSMRNSVLNEDASLPLLAQSNLAPPTVRADAWSNYFNGLIGAQNRLAAAGFKMLSQSFSANSIKKTLLPELATEAAVALDAPIAKSNSASAELTTATEEMLMYGFGLPGELAFNPFFTSAKKAALVKQYADTTAPTLFSNATRSEDLQEIYLYCGAEPDKAQKKTLAGKGEKREVLRLTPEYFFASGARPPYIAPMPVTIAGKTEHWMEGAMRCNPPLAPLIDMGATHIVLIRFFSKDNRDEPHNNAELNDRFLDAMFNIPLQKEIESIALNNQFVQCLDEIEDKTSIPANLRQRREVKLLDPADTNNFAHSAAYTDFLSKDLNALSHYGTSNPALREQMFDRGY